VVIITNISMNRVYAIAEEHRELSWRATESTAGRCVFALPQGLLLQPHYNFGTNSGIVEVITMTRKVS
jgi:hypothetical protein